MSSPELENLVRAGMLKHEQPNEKELEGLRTSAEARLVDAERQDLAFDSRFDLAYNAAHGLALVALRRMGYRSDNRYLVFQALPHTVGAAAGLWRVLAKAHARRNAIEYRGYIEHDERLLAELISATQSLREMLK